MDGIHYCGHLGSKHISQLEPMSWLILILIIPTLTKKKKKKTVAGFRNRYQTPLVNHLHDLLYESVGSPSSLGVGWPRPAKARKWEPHYRPVTTAKLVYMQRKPIHSKTWVRLHVWLHPLVTYLTPFLKPRQQHNASFFFVFKWRDRAVVTGTEADRDGGIRLGFWGVECLLPSSIFHLPDQLNPTWGGLSWPGRWAHLKVMMKRRRRRKYAFVLHTYILSSHVSRRCSLHRNPNCPAPNNNFGYGRFPFICHCIPMMSIRETLLSPIPS